MMKLHECWKANVAQADILILSLSRHVRLMLLYYRGIIICLFEQICIDLTVHDCSRLHYLSVTAADCVFDNIYTAVDCEDVLCCYTAVHCEDHTLDIFSRQQ